VHLCEAEHTPSAKARIIQANPTLDVIPIDLDIIDRRYATDRGLT